MFYEGGAGLQACVRMITHCSPLTLCRSVIGGVPAKGVGLPGAALRPKRVSSREGVIRLERETGNQFFGPNLGYVLELYENYREDPDSVDGRTRDDLPYTPEFDALRAAYNAAVPEPLNERDFWTLLRVVLKCGEENIEVYLEALSAAAAPQ